MIHLVGLVLFLGSIVTFAVASAVPAAGDLPSVAVARRVISNGTNYLTLPGLGLLLLSGLLLHAVESVAGAVNILLTLLAMASGVWRFGVGTADHPLQ
jgi:hypothetical protein